MAKQPAKRAPKTTSPAKSRTGRRTRKPAAPAPTHIRPQSIPVPTVERDLHRSKFTLYNFLAQERAWYLVEPQDVDRPDQDRPDKSVAHQIIIVDRSGSMYGSMDELKSNLLKLLTLDEYSRSDLIVTLISYSSQGDCTVHFQRTPITQIMKPKSREQDQIRGLRVTGATCISQALQLASSLVKDDELTAITIHSDGYANDPSSTAEARRLEELSDALKPQEAFINTIAYTDYSDFRLLSRIANAASGTCMRAENIQQVYDALYNTTKILEGSVAPPIEVPLPPSFDYQIFISRSAGKINGSAGPLRIVGLKAEDDAVIYRYKQLRKEDYEALKDVPVEQTSEAVFAFARAQLAEGHLNTAKYALASSFDATLAEDHGRALTNPQVADLAGALEDTIFDPEATTRHQVLDHVAVNTKMPLLTLVRLLSKRKDGFKINLKHLQQNYIRRGLRHIPGVRDESGNLLEPWLKTEVIGNETYVPVTSFDVNRNTATLNMLITRPVRLVPREGGKPITEVADIKLDKLSIFNNYTLISDGDLHIRTLQVTISDARLFDQLKAEGILELDGETPKKHDPKAEYTLRLETLPLVPPFEGPVKLNGLFEELAELKVMSSLVAAHLKEEAEAFTPEQVEELKRHYLSKSLFVNFPTTTEYSDLHEAIARGTVDTRVSFKIDMGNTQILNLSKLHSANKFLDRMYEMTVNGQKVDKPTFDQTLEGEVSFKHKQLSARTKVTAVDLFMKRLFDDFLGVEKNGSAAAILKRVGATKLLNQYPIYKKGARKDVVSALAEARAKLDDYADKLYQERVSPLVFYVGSTGVLPDEIDAKAQTAEQIQAKYPDLAMSKDEQEGMFFEIGDTILSVYAKNEYFSR